MILIIYISWPIGADHFIMDIGLIKIAEDKDFEKLKKLYDDNNDWKLDYNKPDLSVWTKTVPGISFKMVKVNFY
jgi:hypothetical protein